MGLEDGLLVCGNLNVDRIYTLPYLPAEGQSSPVLRSRETFGGCGGNISLAASMLGCRVKLSTIVGKDLDPSFRKRLVLAGVDLSTMVVDKDLPSPYCIILSTPEGRQAYAFCEGAMGKQKDLTVPWSEGDAPRFVHIAASHPAFTLRTATLLVPKGSAVSLDPGQEIFFRWDREWLSEVMPRCERFFGNVREWTELGRIMGWGKEIRQLSGMDVIVFPEALELVEECIVTMGRNGSFLLDGEGTHQSPPFRVEVVQDPTGAGDAFRGAFYAAKIRGHSSVEALRYGDAMGSLVVGGALQNDGMVTWDTLEGMVLG